VDFGRIARVRCSTLRGQVTSLNATLPMLLSRVKLSNVADRSAPDETNLERFPGLREENASNREPEPPFRFYRNGGSGCRNLTASDGRCSPMWST
jgi:hypothetical protein